jgi:putative phosphoribosyl transferase
MATKMSIDQEQRNVEIPVDHRKLNGILNVPRGAQSIVLFAHGSGSGRLSPRNQYVAGVLQQVGLATLLFDLLDEQEAEDRSKVFNIELLAQRLEATAAWTRELRESKDLRLGYFGASTGAAAALVAAARQSNAVRAVVSRGGRPDLAKDALPSVQAPTLLIVGGHDDSVLELNRRALARLQCEKQLTIVPGATHLFVEAGTLEQVAHLASEWFQKYLTTGGQKSPKGK